MIFTPPYIFFSQLFCFRINLIDIAHSQLFDVKIERSTPVRQFKLLDVLHVISFAVFTLTWVDTLYAAQCMGELFQ